MKIVNSNVIKFFWIFLFWLIMMSCTSVQPSVSIPTLASTPLPEESIQLQDSSGWNWNEIPAPTIQPLPQNDPQMVIDPKGRIHLFWDTYGSSGDAFIYHSFFDAGQWTSPTAIAQTSGISQIRVPPLVTPDGAIHVLWYNQLQLGGPYRLMYAKYDGVSWSTETELYRSEKNPSLSGNLFSDEQSVVHVVIRAPSGLDSDIYYLTKILDGWSTPQSILPQGIGTLGTWKYEPDSSGGVRLYSGGLDGNLIYAYFKNNVVNSQKTNIKLKAYDYNFGDRSGNYYIYRVGQVPIPGGTTTGVYYQCIDGSLTLWPEQLLSGEAAVVTKPQIAQSASRTIMSWITTEY